MSWRGDSSLPYDPRAGRNAFKNDDDGTEHPLARTARAMRSFTESIDTDMPPAPELPASLDIDRYEHGMKNSDTNDTIIEVPEEESDDEVKREDPIDLTLGETQKFKMVVPGPGHTEQETEMHKSLLRDADQDSLDSELEALEEAGKNKESQPATPAAKEAPRKMQDPDHTALRQQYSVTALTRPRPTTPTQQCAIESFAFISQEEEERQERERQEKIKVKIPAGGKRRKSDMSYSEFYDSMSSQIPTQVRRTGSQSGRTTPLNDYEGDILEENPQYREVAPPKPVVNRRTSVEWENFEERKAAETEAQAKLEKSLKGKSREEAAFGGAGKVSKTLASTGFDDSFAADTSTTKMDDDDEGPEFSEDMAEERERFRKESRRLKTDPLKDDTTQKPEEPAKIEPESSGETKPEEASEVETQAPKKEEIADTSNYEQQPEQATTEATDAVEAAQEYDYSQYPGWNPETQQFEGTYIDENGDEQSYAEYYAHYFSQQPYYDESGQEVGYETTEVESYQYPDGSSAEYYQHAEYPSQQPEGSDAVQYQEEQYNADPGTEAEAQNYDYNAEGGYDAEYYNSPEYRKWYEENYGPAPAEEQQYDQAGYDQQQYDANQQYYENGQSGYDQEQTSYHYDQQQTEAEYQEPAYSEEQNYQEEPAQAEVPVETHHQPPPRPPTVIKPLFEAPPVKSDEFGWGAEETTEAQHPTAQAPPRPPPSPARPPQPTHKEEPSSPETPSKLVAAPERPPPAARPPPPRPAPPPVPKKEEPKKEEPEEDAWTQFQRMTAKATEAVKSTGERLKDLEETTAAKDIKDESYLAGVGGSQGYNENLAQQEIRRRLEEKKNEKLLKKKMKQQGKRAASPEYTLDDQEKMDRASEELARQMAAKMAVGPGDAALVGWKAPEAPPPKPTIVPAPERKDSAPPDAIPPRKKSSIKEAHQESSSLDLPSHAPLTFQQSADSAQPIGDFHPDDPALTAPSWADFEASAPELPPSESGFFSKDSEGTSTVTKAGDPFAMPPKEDPFAAPADANLFDDNYDPFDVRPVEDIVAAAKAKAEAAKMSSDGQDDDYFGATDRRSNLSTPTQEGGSPISARPTGFEDEFKCERGSNGSTPTPLYDEDDSQPLDDYIPKFTGEGWELMIRHPLKKKIMADRFWKPCFVRLHGNTLIVFNSKNDNKPIQELLLQATYSLSDTTLQAYDVYGKIHTVKLQYVQYKERVGIRPGQISRLVEGHVTKYGLPLEHSAQCNVLLKFGSLNADELQSFVNTIEDVLFKCPAKRDTKPQYKQDEVQIHCYDEYTAHVDKLGIVSDQRARVRMFCLAFVSGSPFLEIGLNDRRRQGKEIVRRKDILPMYTERWIRFENLEFHNTVEQPAFESEQVIRLQPPDGCFFEIMRFRVRPPKNREKALTVKCIMKIAGSKVEIRMEAMAAAQVERSKGGKATRRQIPCEDIVIRFPIPEAWIYIFREERHWGVGSVHSKKLRPGKVKNLKDRLLGAVQQNESNLIEVAIGEAKYEHVYRSLVWRIPRLPEKHHAAYKAHLLKCRFELSSFDLMPETFLPNVDVDFTMPLATVSNTVVRSVSVEQHEDSDRVEKYVRYVAKCRNKVEIDYIQCADLDVDAVANSEANPEDTIAIPEMHRPAMHPTDVADMHEGYRIDLPEAQFKRDDSSSDEDEAKTQFPTIKIDMSNYGY